MVRGPRSQLLGFAAGAVTATVIAGGLAYAAGPSDSTTVHACFAKSDAPQTILGLLARARLQQG